MKRRSAIATVLLAGLALPLAAVATSASSQARAAAVPDDLVWLALGDSYSSGEGLRYVDTDANPPGTTCERATGRSTVNNGNGSRAYAAVAYDELRGDWENSEFRLLACTGATSDKVFGQYDEWRATDPRKADLVTLSMGGNDLGFADVIFGCVGISFEGGFAAAASLGYGAAAPIVWGLNPAVGCTVSEDTLRQRIADVVGPDGSQTLANTYREFAKNSMNPGGHIIVVGYPNIIEQSSDWTMSWFEGNRCHRIRRADAAMLRSVTGELNLQLYNMVNRLNAESLGVTFSWLDASLEYENARGRHGLCTGDPWLNGITSGVNGPHTGNLPGRLTRSFHPTQDGHDAVGAKLAQVVAGLDWSRLTRTQLSPGTSQPPADVDNVPSVQIWACEEFLREPESFNVGCTSSAFTDFTWTGWGNRSAFGEGTLISGSTPETESSVGASVELTDRVEVWCGDYLYVLYGSLILTVDGSSSPTRISLPTQPC